MEMLFYYVSIAMGAIAVLIAIAVTIAARRVRHPSVIAQLIGVISTFAATVMARLPLLRFSGNRITTTWIWRAEGILSSGGLLLFSVGYCWYRITAKHHQSSGFPVDLISG